MSVLSLFHPEARPHRWPVGARIRATRRTVRHVKPPVRRRSRLPVRVLTTSGAHPATVTGVSLYGACLDGGHRLRRREIIALRLPSGWRVKARVCWRLGRRCGVKFMIPVADFARLLCEGGAIQPTARHRLQIVRPRAPEVASAEMQPSTLPDRRGTWLRHRATTTIQALRRSIAEWRQAYRAVREVDTALRCRAVDGIGILPPLP